MTIADFQAHFNRMEEHFIFKYSLILRLLFIYWNILSMVLLDSWRSHEEKENYLVHLVLHYRFSNWIVNYCERDYISSSLGWQFFKVLASNIHITFSFRGFDSKRSFWLEKRVRFNLSYFYWAKEFTCKFLELSNFEHLH